MCVRIFIEVSDYTYMSICILTVFLKKLNQAYLAAISNFKFQTSPLPGRRLHITHAARCAWLPRQSHLASTTTARGREGEGDGAEEAPEAGARRPRLRLVPASRAAEEEGAEAGTGEEAAGCRGGGEAAAATEAGEVCEAGSREPGLGASSCEVRPPGVAAPAAQADAHRPSSPSLQLVSCQRAARVTFCVIVDGGSNCSVSNWVLRSCSRA
jgi:hypothetical protein